MKRPRTQCANWPGPLGWQPVTGNGVTAEWRECTKNDPMYVSVCLPVQVGNG